MVALAHFLLSWALTLLGIALLLLPVYAIRKIAQKRFPDWNNTATGIAFGFIAWPFSLWLYLQFYQDRIRAFIFGFIGLLLIAMHTWPLNFIPIGTLSEIPSNSTWWYAIAPYVTLTIAISGLIWAIFYGLIGLGIDRYLIWRENGKEKG